MKRRLFALVLALLMTASLVACGASSKEAGYMEEYAATEAPAEDYFAASTSESENVPSAPLPTAEKIIYTAYLDMETTKFDDAVASFEKAVAEMGGYLLNSSVNGSTGYNTDGSVYIYNRYASYSAAVPSDKLDAFLSTTGTLGNVLSCNRDAENVTSQYTDYEARVTSLQTEETRLLELLAKAEDVDALIALESRLSDVRYEIESIQRNLRDLDRRLAYSTVNLDLREVSSNRSTAPVTRSFGQRLVDSLLGGAEEFFGGLGDFVIWLAAAILPLLLLAAITVAIVFWVKHAAKKKRAKKEKENPQA